MLAVSRGSRLLTSLGTSLKESVMALSSAAKLDLAGIFPPITIPFDEKEDVDFASLEKNVHKWNKIPFRGLVVHGSNGEFPYLDADERVDIVKRVKSWISGNKLILAGSGCESTRATIRMGQTLADAGADALLVITPSFFKGGLTSEALCEHFTKVADNSPVPVILYSVPAMTGVDLAAEAVIILARHPNIIGLKESSGNVTKMGHIAHHTRAEDFQVLAGSASFILQSHVVGSVGGVCALANCMGEEVCRLHELCKSGDIAAASLLQQKLIGPNDAVTKKFGVPGLKFAMEKFGYVGGRPRSPLRPLPETKQQLLLADFKHDGFLT